MLNYTAALDAGILIAITNADEKELAVGILLELNNLRKNRVPFFTTTPVLTEAMYICRKNRGASGAVALIANINKFGIEIFIPDSEIGIIKNYDFLLDRNVDVDYADFHLFSTALEADANHILTVDRNDFSTLTGAYTNLKEEFPHQPIMTRQVVNNILVFS